MQRQRERWRERGGEREMGQRGRKQSERERYWSVHFLES